MIEELYKLYKHDVYYYLYGLTHNQNLSEDLTAEVFTASIKSLPNFKGNSNIKTWLFSIARHKWYEYIRKEKKDKSILDIVEIYMTEKDCLVEESYLSKEIANRILELLEKEGERQREIVLMRIDGYSFHEIALKVEISESSARVIDFRTRKKIKAILIKEGFKDE